MLLPVGLSVTIPVNTGVDRRAKAAWTVAAAHSVPSLPITLLVPDGASVKRPVFETVHTCEEQVFRKLRTLAVVLVLVTSSVELGAELLVPTYVFVPFSV